MEVPCWAAMVYGYVRMSGYFEKTTANFNDIKAILLTHLHVDHSAALPVYIKAGYFTRRKKDLMVFGPTSGDVLPSTEDFVSAFFNDTAISVYPYLSDNIRRQKNTDFLIKPKGVKADGNIWRKALSKALSIAAIKVTHGHIPALAWRINFRKCSVTFSGDMNGSSGNLQKLARNTDLLVANNAIAQDSGRIAKFLHMTPETIGEIAGQAQVKKLALSHFMLRSLHRKEESLSVIKQNYRGDVIFTDDLMMIDF